MSNVPKYLVQGVDGTLHGYQDAVGVRIAIGFNGGEQVKLFRLTDVPGYVSYVPMTREELKSME
jgi:hypothetical protein